MSQAKHLRLLTIWRRGSASCNIVAPAALTGMHLRLLSILGVTFSLAGCGASSRLGLGSSAPASSTDRPKSSSAAPASDSSGSSDGGSAKMPPDIAARYDEARDGEAMRFLEQLARGNDYYSGNTKKAMAAFEKIAAFDRACKQHNFARYSNGGGYRDPAEECKAAAGYKAAASAHFGPLAAKQLASTLRTDEQRIDGLVKKGWTDPTTHADFSDPAAYLAKLREPYAAAIRTYGLVLDAEVLGKLEANAKRYPAALAAAAKVSRFPAGLRSDAQITAAATDRMADIGKVLAAGFDDDWTVSKNDLGVPEYKWNNGHLKVQATGEAHCRIYKANLQMTHEGRGRYAKPHLKSVADDYQVSRCK